MANPDLVKNYDAGADIAAYTIVKLSGDGTVVPAAAATDLLVGVSQHIAVKNGQPVDVIHEGIANVKAGGAITRGNFVTADANGEGVLCDPAAGTNARYIGIALVTAADGDIIPILVQPGIMQGAD